MNLIVDLSRLSLLSCGHTTLLYRYFKVALRQQTLARYKTRTVIDALKLKRSSNAFQTVTMALNEIEMKEGKKELDSLLLYQSTKS